MNTQTAKKTAAEVKVLAINCLNEWAVKFYEHAKKHFSQFIGQDIFKNDMTIKKKYEQEKISYTGQLSDGTYSNAHYWLTANRGFSDITIKICVNGGSYDVRPNTAFCQYEQTTLTLFKLEDNKLIETNTDISHLSRRYSVPELEAIAARVKAAAEKYELAQKEMPYIFRDTFYIERLTR